MITSHARLRIVSDTNVDMYYLHFLGFLASEIIIVETEIKIEKYQIVNLCRHFAT